MWFIVWRIKWTFGDHVIEWVVFVCAYAKRFSVKGNSTKQFFKRIGHRDSVTVLTKRESNMNFSSFRLSFSDSGESKSSKLFRFIFLVYIVQSYCRESKQTKWKSKNWRTKWSKTWRQFKFTCQKKKLSAAFHWTKSTNMNISWNCECDFAHFAVFLSPAMSIFSIFLVM